MVIKYCSNYYYICSNLLMSLSNLMNFAAIAIFALFSLFCSNNENCSFTCHCHHWKWVIYTQATFVIEHLTFFLTKLIIWPIISGPNISWTKHFRGPKIVKPKIFEKVQFGSVFIYFNICQKFKTYTKWLISLGL